MTYSTLISAAELADHLDDPAWAIVRVSFRASVRWGHITSLRRWDGL